MTIRTVRFYTRPGCHLCEEAGELLEDLAAECPMDLDMIDITLDADIYARYRFEIPVIAVEGGGTVSGRITIDGLREALRLGPPRLAVPPLPAELPPTPGKTPGRKPR